MGESGAVERSGSDDGGDAVRGDAAAAGRRTTRSRGRRVARLVAAQLELAAAGRCATSVLVIDVGAVSSFEPGALDRTPDSAACHAITVCLSGCGGRAHLLPLRHQLAQFRTFPTAEAAARTLTGHGLYPDTDPDDEHPDAGQHSDRRQLVPRAPGPPAEAWPPSAQTVVVADPGESPGRWIAPVEAVPVGSS